jgi:hypothetical protein
MYVVLLLLLLFSGGSVLANAYFSHDSSSWEKDWILVSASPPHIFPLPSPVVFCSILFFFLFLNLNYLLSFVL